ncbi:MAG: BON domain-containing protein [Candidatus Altiarchaeales archaeon]|nr:BON domain-containing protein [Candidatus Altiarchaeales archaeon]MBD3416881.1 BON domain-containing protein [Candidatus Altiarchaeales archaeon]
MKPDESVKKDVVDQLSWDTRLDASSILVKVDGNAVTLTGEVPNYSNKMGAERVVHAIRGVESVENLIEVRFPEGFKVPDNVGLQTTVKTFLDLNTRVDDRNIGVKAEDGRLYLEGTVPTLYEKIVAEKEAKSIVGVLDVVNKLAVTPTEKIADELVGEHVMRRIEKNSIAEVDGINVTVSNGKVGLTGTVPSWSQWMSVIEAARHTKGVVDIEDRLSIRYNT